MNPIVLQSLRSGVLVLATASGLSTAADDAMPPEVRAHLDRELPGWQLPRLGPAIKQCNAQAKVIVSGDFDGDGRTDYAVEVVHRDELVLLAVLGTGRARTLARTPYQPSAAGLDQGLDVLAKHERIMDGPAYAHDAVISLDCSQAATVTYFSVVTGKWRNDLQVTE